MKIPNELNNTPDNHVNYPKVSSIGLLLFCGYVIFCYLQIGYRIPLLGAIRFEFIYAFILTGIVILINPKPDFRTPLNGYLLLYLFFILIQIPFSYDFASSWDVFIDRIIKFAFMAIFIISFVRSPTHLKIFFTALSLVWLKIGLEGFLGKITGSLMWWNQGILRLHGTTPNYAHPNSFASIALESLPFVYYLWPLSNVYFKFLISIICVFSINIILFSGSRTGYIGSLVLLLFIFYKSRYKIRLLFISFIVMLILIPRIPSDYVERFHSISTGTDQSGHSTEARIQILKDAVQIFCENPLGIGVAAFPKMRMAKFGREQDTHNLYLQIATNLGIQGLVVFTLLIYNLLKLLHSISVNAKSHLIQLETNINSAGNELHNDLRLIKATAEATTLFVIMKLVTGFFGSDMYEMFWWFAMGISISLCSMMRNIQFALNNAIFNDK